MKIAEPLPEVVQINPQTPVKHHAAAPKTLDHETARAH